MGKVTTGKKGSTVLDSIIKDREETKNQKRKNSNPDPKNNPDLGFFLFKLLLTQYSHPSIK